MYVSEKYLLDKLNGILFRVEAVHEVVFTTPAGEGIDFTGRKKIWQEIEEAQISTSKLLRDIRAALRVAGVSSSADTDQPRNSTDAA